jgi:hypothetical protein
MTFTPGHRRRGVALFEVIVALVVLVTAGAAAVTLAGTVLHSMAHANQRDAEFQAASAFLDDVALWSRDDLDRHLGARIEGDWRMEIDRPWPAVYTVRLVDTLSTETLLETSIYRRATPEATDAR